jgi:hypothetical protein
MGGTQIALVIVGIVLLVIAAFIAVTQFSDDPVAANEEAISWDASLAVATAARWYKESGAQSFEGMTLETINVAPSNDNGTFELQSVTEKGFQLIATGTEDGDGDGEPLQFRLTYNAFSDSTIWERVEE